jgi:hypothetical protein
VGELARRFTVALIPGGVMWLAYRWHPVTNALELCLACATYSVLYAALCFATRLVTVQDIKAVFGGKLPAIRI